MNKKIFIILFFMFVLISMSAVSAADANVNNDSIVSYGDAEILSASNDVNAIDDLNSDYSDGDDKAPANYTKSVAVAKNNEIIGAANEEDNGDSESPILGDGDYSIEVNFSDTYNPNNTIVSYHIEGPEPDIHPNGDLEIYINKIIIGKFGIDGKTGQLKIDPLPADTYQWRADFRPKGGMRSKADGLFTINQANSTIVVLSPPESSSIDVGRRSTISAYVSPMYDNPVISSSDESIVKVENSNFIAISPGTATITFSYAGNQNYTAAENKTITVTVKGPETPANWTYINTDGKEVSIDGNIQVPWNESLECYVTYANGTALPEGTNITILCKGEQPYTINTVTQENGLFKVNLSNVKPGSYLATFSAENYTTATATLSVVKLSTEINVTNTDVSLKVNENISTGATLTPADAGNLTYTSSNSSIAIVENGKIKAIKEGKVNITVSFEGNEKYFAAENKTIAVTVTLNDASVTAKDISLNLGAKATIDATTIPKGLNITYTPDNSGVVTVENGVVTAVKEGTAKITLTVGGDGVYAENSTTITVKVGKIDTEIKSSAVSTVYKVNKNLVATLTDANGNAISGVKVTVNLNSAKTYTTDENGQIKVSTKGLAPKTYTAKITFDGNDNYTKSTKDVKVTVKKATPKLTAKKKTFKKSKKVKKYKIVLKDNTGKAIKKVKVTLKVKGKTYKAKTNRKGKATFKITKLKKKGTFKAKITYKGNKYFKKVSKKAKIKVIFTWKTISKGSKNKATVKKIQQALKNKGYYTTYKGYYLKIDGTYGNLVVRSVKEFQHDKGIKVTGKVNEKTAHKLGII